MKIPVDIESLMHKQPGTFFRENANGAQQKLIALGVSENTEVFAFLSVYKMPLVSGGNSLEELMDISEPSEDMRRVTEFAWENYQLPRDIIVLTSCEGEGFYGLSLSSGEVFDINLNTLQGDISGQGKWNSFFVFIKWFLT